MANDYSEVKTFKQARERLEEMAAGRYLQVEVKWCGGKTDNGVIPPYLRCELYIDHIGTVGAVTWAEAFAAMEARIRALDSDHDHEALTAGVDEAMQEVEA